MRIIRLNAYPESDRVGGFVYNSDFSLQDDDIVYFGINPFSQFPKIPEPLCKLRKVVSVSDLHHGERPVERCLEYAHSVHTHGLIVPYNICTANSLRSIGVNVVPRTIDYGYIGSIIGNKWLSRKAGLLHTGRISTFHGQRKAAIEFLRSINFDIIQYNGTPKNTWDTAKSYMFHLNVPIAGDRNCRFWETLLTGGLLFQPEIPACQYSDISPIIQKSIIHYSSYNDLVDKYMYFSSNLEHAKEIAANATRQAWKYFVDSKIADITLIHSLINNRSSLCSLSPENLQYYIHHYRMLDRK